MKGKKSNIIILNSIIFSIFFIIIVWLFIEINNEKKIRNINNYEISSLSSEQNSMDIKKSNINTHNQIKEAIIKQYPKEEVINEYKGYDVIAKLEIPKIKLNTYILKNYSDNALNVSVTKFWGANPNEVGNFCVAGHNFQNKNMFHNLKNVNVNDRLFISDNNIGKVEYEIFDVYKVFPKDVSCLSQNTNNFREVTLITCTNDSEMRIIVKAKEVMGD